MHVMNNYNVQLDNGGYMKILETVEVFEAYKSLKETFSIKLQESLYGLKQSMKKNGTKE